VTATHSGDSNYQSSTATTSFTINKASISIDTAVDDAATNNPWSGTEVTGASAYDTSTVSGVESHTPAGSVTYDFFQNDTCSGTATTIQTVTITAGSVPSSNATAALGAGSYSFNASYSGDPNYQPKTSSCEPFSVNKASTSFIASANPTSTTYGNTVQLSATGLPSNAGGTVTFSANNSTLCSASVSSGSASCTTGVLPAGTYSVTATYSGDSNYQGSTASTSFTITSPPNLSITKTADAGTVSAGSAIGFTLTISNSSAAGTGTATAATISDPLPGGSGVSWSISPSYGGPGTCGISGSPQLLSCSLGDLAPVASVSVHVSSSTMYASCGSYPNTVTAGASNSPTKTASASITVQCPKLTVTKSADAASVPSGGPIGFTVGVTNSSAPGTGTATAVTLSDPLPGGTGISWSISPTYGGPGSCSITGSAPIQTLSCTFGNLTPGALASVHVKSSTASSSCAVYGNTATAAASNHPPVSASSSTTVVCASSIVYTGTQAVIIGTAMTPAAKVSAASPCQNVGNVIFSLDRNPAGGVNPFPVSAGLSGGTATASALPTSGWTAVVYTLTATYSGPAYCAPSSDTVTITVGTAGTRAGAAARYSLPNGGPYTVSLSYARLSGGSLDVAGQAGGWSIKGSITILVVDGSGDGAVSGAGTLYYNASVVATNVQFTASFHGNIAPFTFGLHISYIPTGAGVTTWFNALPVTVSNGSITDH
jgi:uncharacterized repeat protein (TIGR01451 family)